MSGHNVFYEEVIESSSSLFTSAVLCLETFGSWHFLMKTFSKFYSQLKTQSSFLFSTRSHDYLLHHPRSPKPATKEKGKPKSSQNDRRHWPMIKGRPRRVAPVIKLTEAVGNVVVVAMLKLKLFDLIEDVHWTGRRDGRRSAAFKMICRNVPSVWHHLGETAADDVCVRWKKHQD